MDVRQHTSTFRRACELLAGSLPVRSCELAVASFGVTDELRNIRKRQLSALKVFGGLSVVAAPLLVLRIVLQLGVVFTVVLLVILLPMLATLAIFFRCEVQTCYKALNSSI